MSLLQNWLGHPQGTGNSLLPNPISLATFQFNASIYYLPATGNGGRERKFLRVIREENKEEKTLCMAGVNKTFPLENLMS